MLHETTALPVSISTYTTTEANRQVALEALIPFRKSLAEIPVLYLFALGLQHYWTEQHTVSLMHAGKYLIFLYFCIMFYLFTSTASVSL